MKNIFSIISIFLIGIIVCVGFGHSYAAKTEKTPYAKEFSIKKVDVDSLNLKVNLEKSGVESNVFAFSPALFRKATVFTFKQYPRFLYGSYNHIGSGKRLGSHLCYHPKIPNYLNKV